MVHTAVITMGVTLGTVISAATISIFGNGPPLPSEQIKQ
jgi:hypothetical protein